MIKELSPEKYKKGYDFVMSHKVEISFWLSFMDWEENERSIATDMMGAKMVEGSD